MYVSFDNYRQNYINAAYHHLKDEVRRRALNEMRVQQIYDTMNIESTIIVGRGTRVLRATWSLEAAEDLRNWMGSCTSIKNTQIKNTHDWKKEGF